jgi:hypothetical protein
MVKTTGKSMGLLLRLVLSVGLAGCAGGARQVKEKVPSDGRTEIFLEVMGNELPPPGSVDLTIKAKVKTPTREHFLLESRTPPPTEGGFAFDLDIYGQEIVWKAEGILEKAPSLMKKAEPRKEEKVSGIPLRRKSGSNPALITSYLASLKKIIIQRLSCS